MIKNFELACRGNWKKVYLFFFVLVSVLSQAFSQSWLPGTTDTWLTLASAAGNGSLDNIAVIFFEVPDTVTEDLYFYLYDPANDGGGEEQNPAGTTNYYLC